VPKRYYSLQFKDEACKLAASKDYTPARAAQQLGVHLTTLRSWMKQRNLLPPSQPVSEPPMADDPEALKTQLRQARERIRELEINQEILKKAAAFFAKENLR
jgi:transposase